MVLAKIVQLLVMNIAAPTGDMYSDISLAIELWMGGHCYSAAAVLTPVIVAFIFTVVVFVNYEENKTWYSWIFLFLLVWPQYRAVRIIGQILRKDPDWQKEKEKMDGDVFALEPFVESLPQCYILTTLYLLDTPRFTPSREGLPHQLVTNTYTFYPTYVFSILTGTAGLVKFYKVGPARFLPSAGPLSGYFTGRYLFTFLCVLITGLTKGFLFAFMFVRFYEKKHNNFKQQNRVTYGNNMSSNSSHDDPPVTVTIQSVAFSFSVSILPYVLFSALILLATLKSRFLSVLSKYPQFLLSPVFTPFVFAFGYNDCSRDGRLALSKLFTWFNLVLHCLVAGACCVVDGLYVTAQGIGSTVDLLAIEVGLALVVCVIMTQHVLLLDHCCICPEGSFCYCFPFTEITVLDPAYPEEKLVLKRGKLVPVDEVQRKSGERIEMMPKD